LPTAMSRRPRKTRSLASFEKSYGPEHPNVATSLNNLAELLRDTNRLTEAEPLYRRALASDEKSYGLRASQRRHKPQQPGRAAAGH
jgi:Tetratricopeptide repeat